MVDLLLGNELGDAVRQRLTGHALQASAHLGADTVEAKIRDLVAAPIQRHDVSDLLVGAWARRHQLRLVDAVSTGTVGVNALELRDHREDIEQQLPYGVCGVIDRPAQAEADLPGGELLGDRASIRQGAGKPVELGDDQGVAGAARRESLAESRALAVGAGQSVVDVDAVGLHTEA